MKRLVIALAALVMLSPIAALAQTQPDQKFAQTQAHAANSSAVPDYIVLEVAGQ